MEATFLDALIRLMDAHGVKLCESEDYDGEDSYCGSRWSFEGEGVSVSIGDIEDAQDKPRRKEHGT